MEAAVEEEVACIERGFALALVLGREVFGRQDDAAEHAVCVQPFHVETADPRVVEQGVRQLEAESLQGDRLGAGNEVALMLDGGDCPQCRRDRVEAALDHVLDLSEGLVLLEVRERMAARPAGQRVAGRMRQRA